MTARTLHLPERPGFSRWMLAALAILAAHAAIAASVALWYASEPVEPNIIPAISVTLAPVDAASPEIQDQDIAVGPTMQQAEAAPAEPPKQEQVEKVEQPPAPQQQADVTLPQETPKEVEKPTPQAQPPAPETRAPPKTENVGQLTQASANAYNALVYLQRFKRYPAAARGAAGTTVIRFELNRAGDVISSEIEKSSGKTVLDQEALEILRRASPFPPFPSAKPGAHDTYLAPINFSH
ncbi:outer membrane transport energization protein TonB [Bradyrhizobium erythrophlei]|jgi:protein TonB|nr:outer membrane transport energization protein TonB [Bradyrhizobium erythrophlei]